MSDISYHHAPSESRYEVRDGGRVIGLAAYREPDETHVAFTHTEVSEEYGGQGLAGELVSFALADARERGRRIVPYCSYVARWLRKHPGQYDDLVDWPD